MASSNPSPPTSTSPDSKSQRRELDRALWDGIERKDWQYQRDRSSGLMPSSVGVTREEMAIYTRQRIRQRENEAAERKAADREPLKRTIVQSSARRRRGSQPLRPSPLSQLSTLDTAAVEYGNTRSESGAGSSVRPNHPPVSPLAPGDKDLPDIPKSPQVSPLVSDGEDEVKEVPSPLRRRPAMRRSSVREAYIGREAAGEGEDHVHTDLPQINIERSESPRASNDIQAPANFPERDHYGRPLSPGHSPAPSRGSPSSQMFDMSPLGNELERNHGNLDRSGRSYFPRLSPTPPRGSPSPHILDMSPLGDEIDPRRGSSSRRK